MLKREEKREGMKEDLPLMHFNSMSVDGYKVNILSPGGMRTTMFQLSDMIVLFIKRA